MHYVLKNKIARFLLATSVYVKNELFRVQDRILTVDQNNIGDGDTNDDTEDTGLFRGSFFPASSGSDATQAEANYGSLTRIHSDKSGTKTWTPSPPSGFPEGVLGDGEGWVDQSGVASSDHTFTVYHTGPYLFLAQATLWGEVDVGGDKQVPLNAYMSVRLDGELILPYVTGRYALRTENAGFFIYIPLFFQASKILTPGEHRATITLKRVGGIEQAVKFPNLVVVGLLR